MLTRSDGSLRPLPWSWRSCGCTLRSNASIHSSHVCPQDMTGVGQWTSDDSFIQPAAGRERDRLSGQDLAKDPHLNRHIVDGHVGKTDQELIARLAEMQERILFGLLPNPTPRKRVGSFDSIESARSYISDTLKNNIDEVNRVAAGTQRDAFWLFDRTRSCQHSDGHANPNQDHLWRRYIHNSRSSC